MPIELHCDHCGTLVRAPDDAGGKHGKCPTCHQSVYIPMPDEQLEPLDIAPVDDVSESEQARLRKEALELQRRLMKEKDLPPPGPAVRSARPPDQVRIPRMDMETLLIEYARAMAAGNLEQAEQYANDIRVDLDAADEIIQRIVSDDIPPDELAQIPRPVLVGFFKQLQGKKK